MKEKRRGSAKTPCYWHIWSGCQKRMNSGCWCFLPFVYLSVLKGMTEAALFSCLPNISVSPVKRSLYFEMTEVWARVVAKGVEVEREAGWREAHTCKERLGIVRVWRLWTCRLKGKGARKTARFRPSLRGEAKEEEQDKEQDWGAAKSTSTSLLEFNSASVCSSLDFVSLSTQKIDLMTSLMPSLKESCWQEIRSG